MLINLRCFPIEASVALLAELEARGVEIEIADERAEHFAKQVIRARATSMAEVSRSTQASRGSSTPSS